MSDKATAVAPANIAFIKYWGIRDSDQTLPYNASISMTLTACVSRCTVELLPEGPGELEVLVRTDGILAPAPPGFSRGIERHLLRLKTWAGIRGTFRVATENSFPTGAGLASSASGFAALTLAAAAALGRPLKSRELSILARSSGSGSAARSAFGGYVEWPDDKGEGSARQLAEASHWALSDVVAVVSSAPKEVSSREGHRRAPGSQFFARRLERLGEKLRRVRAAIAERDIGDLGSILEEEALELHLIAMSSRPPIFYWTAGTIAVLRSVRRLREGGLAAYATIDAGPNVHVICPSDEEVGVAAALRELNEVESVIVDRVGNGPFLTEDHLV
ncbi:MAG: diphosphomevalonate decarboxylase [Acidobacteriota bacterium]|nr:diphosphomevalonate decarboxylase [Acidobacteriota bacterium]